MIWGSTWLIIKFQLGVVDPLLSVCYRFGLAGILLIVYAKAFKLNLSFTFKQHLLIALQGTLLFGLNYWLVYVSELYLTSGLVAVAFSMLIFLNIFFGAILLKYSIKRSVIYGAILGLAGTFLLLKQELTAFNWGNESFLGLVYCATAIVLSSLGNITSAYNQKQKIPVIQTNAFGMLYGALLMLIMALAMGKPISFDPSYSYILSLFYLVIFGSIIGFGCYLTLIGRIGVDKAAYAIVLIPVVALTLSFIFESFQITYYAISGIFLILTGNILALRKKS